MTSTEKRQLVDSNHPHLSIQAQCEALGLNRSTYYYKPIPISPENLDLMKLLEEIHYLYPEYGYRRAHAHLCRHYKSFNIKRIERLWTILGYKSLLPKPNLSSPNQSHPSYPYLLEGMTIDCPNKVFSTDITYLPVGGGFVYLVMIIDWYSRYILSWEISNSMSVHFCLDALEKSLSKAVPEYFNTDQGSQFTSAPFLKLLEEKHIKVSMDGKGRAIDNVYIERAWWSLKYERLYLNPPATVGDLVELVSTYVSYYNSQRPHQALQYATPDEIYHLKNPKYMKKPYEGFVVKKAKTMMGASPHTPGKTLSDHGILSEPLVY